MEAYQTHEDCGYGYKLMMNMTMLIKFGILL